MATFGDDGCEAAGDTSSSVAADAEVGKRGLDGGVSEQLADLEVGVPEPRNRLGGSAGGLSADCGAAAAADPVSDSVDRAAAKRLFS